MFCVLVAAVRSMAVVIHRECLVQNVKSCYNVYLGSQSVVNQLCAKASVVQILMIVFTRVEADAVNVEIKKALVADVLDLADKSLNDSNLVLAVKNFINDVMVEEKLRECEVGEGDVGGHAGGMSKIREDEFLLFKNLCKFSMKFAAPGENPEDPLLLRGKVLSLELLKLVIENAGTFWLVNERFLGAIKQAADNQLFVATCSPARDASAGYVAWGHSTLAGPFGEVIATTEHEEAIIVEEIDYSLIELRRSNLPLQNQRRGDLYQFVDVQRSSHHH